MHDLENKLLQPTIDNISSEEWNTIYNDENLRNIFLRRIKEGVIFDPGHVTNEIVELLYSNEYFPYFLNCFKMISPSDYVSYFSIIGESDLVDENNATVIKYYNENKEEIIKLFLEHVDEIGIIKNIDFINLVIQNNLVNCVEKIMVDNPTPEIEEFIINILDKIDGKIKTYSKRIEERCLDIGKELSIIDFYDKSEELTKAILKDFNNGNVTRRMSNHDFIEKHSDDIGVIKYKIANDEVESLEKTIDEHPELEDYVVDLIKSGKIGYYYAKKCYNYPRIMAAVIEKSYSVTTLTFELSHYWDNKLSISFDKDPEIMLEAIAKIVDNNVSEARSILDTISHISDNSKFDRIIQKLVSMLTFDVVIDVLNEYDTSPLKKILNEYSDYYNYSIDRIPDSFDLGRRYNEKVYLSVIPLLSIDQLDPSKFAESYYKSDALVEAIVTRLAELKSNKFNNTSYLFHEHITPKVRDIILRKDNPLNLSVKQIVGFLGGTFGVLDNDTVDSIIKRNPTLSSEGFRTLYSLLVSLNMNDQILENLKTLLNHNIEIDNEAFDIIENKMDYIYNYYNQGYKDKTLSLLREFILKHKNVPLKLTTHFDEEVRKQSTYDVNNLSISPSLFDHKFPLADYREFVLDAIKNNKPVDLVIIFNLTQNNKDYNSLLKYENVTYNHPDTIKAISRILDESYHAVEENCVYNWLKKCDINELFRVHHQLISKILNSEVLFKELMELAEDKDIIYPSFLLNALNFKYYGDEFKIVVKEYIEKQILSNRVTTNFLNLTKELVQLDNPIVEKFLTDNYFAKLRSFPWLSGNTELYQIVKNKSFYFDALINNIKNNRFILNNCISNLHLYPELIDIYIDGIKAKEFTLKANSIYQVHFNPKIVKIILEINPHHVNDYIEFLTHHDGIEWVNEETFDILVSYAVPYYNINKEAIIELAKAYGFDVLKLLTNERVVELFRKDIDTVKKYIELFKVRELDYKSIEAINDSIQQKLFAKNNPNDINIFSNILAAVQRGITEEEINNIINILCKKDSNGKYLYMLDNLSIDDVRLSELYKTNKEEFIKELLALLSQDQNKYTPILNMITSNYIAEKRNELTRNEDIYRDTNVNYHYDTRQLYDAYFKYFRDNFKEDFFLGILTKGYNSGYVGNKELDKLTVQFLYNPEQVQVSKEELIEIKKNIRSVKERLGELYFCEINPQDIDSKYLENVKKIIDLDTRKLSINDFSRVNIESVLDLIANKEKYDLLIKVLDKYKFLDWGDIFGNLKNELSLSGDDFDMFNFINAFSAILDNESRLLKQTGEDTISFNGFKILKYSSIYSSVANGYKVLFGIEDYEHIKQNNGPNSAGADVQSRLDYDADLLIKMIQSNAVTIPSFSKDFDVSNSKKLRVIVGCRGDTRNLTIGERTGACMRAYGAANALFTFTNTDSRGFQIVFEDPETGIFISRVSGFRNGNTVFLNELRHSVDNKMFSDEDVIKACYDVAKELVELSKDSEMPIENVVVSPDQVLWNYPCQKLSQDDIGKDVFLGYKNVSSNAVVLSTIGVNGNAVPLKLNGDNQPVYKSCRLPVRAYKYPNITDSIKVLLQRINLIKETIELGNLSRVKTMDFDMDILDNEYMFAIIGQDFFVALDKNGVITHNIAILTEESQKEYQEAIDQVTEVKKELTGGMENGKTI